MSEHEGPLPEPRVHCPRCGKRFRVDPAGLEGRADGAPARCSGCRATFRIRRSDTGAVEVFDPAAAARRADATPPRGKRRRRRRPPGPSKRSEQPAMRSRTPNPPEADDVSGLGMGERTGRYEIEALLGRGGMGAVYRAFDPATNRHVALKVLAAGSGEADRRRFRREIEVQGNIQHAHIMPIHDSGARSRSLYFTMELLRDPVDLAELVALSHRGLAAKDPYLRPASTLRGIVRRVLLPVCQAIHHANVREGVLHRDLKPEHVLLDRNGLRPLVIDFGVCSLLERKNRRLAHLPPETPERLAGGKFRITGTLLYMPPEQARGGEDRRGDVWALGAILHHVLTGAPPFEPATRSTVSAFEQAEGLRLLIAQARREGNRKDECEFQAKLDVLVGSGGRTLEDVQKDVLASRILPRPSTTPRALDAIAAKAMAAEPENRYRHALELHDDLLAWLDGRPVRAFVQRRGPVLGALYRGGLFLRRHRKAAALLLVASVLGAWGAAGLRERGGPDGAPPPAPEVSPCKIREGLRAAEVARAESTHLPAARGHVEVARAAFAEGRYADGRASTAALAQLLRSGVLSLLARCGTDAQRDEIDAFERLATGRRVLEIRGATKGSREARFDAVPVEDHSGRIAWTRALPIDGREPSLPYGRWIVRVTGPGVACWPVEVRPGGEPLVVECPVPPAHVPEGRVYVVGGRVRGPLGEVSVGPLLWDPTEVTAAHYAVFLATLPPAERLLRVPRTPGAPGAPDRISWEKRGDRFLVPPDAARRPVEGISFHDARAFAKHAGGRLPTAAEWAWAASGADGRLCPLGPVELLRDVRIAQPRRGPADVAATRVDRSPFGLCDMAGNVAEYTRTLATYRGTSGWLVMGGGYTTSRGQALITEATPVPGWRPHEGIGFRLVYDPK